MTQGLDAWPVAVARVADESAAEPPLTPAATARVLKEFQAL